MDFLKDFALVVIGWLGGAVDGFKTASLEGPHGLREM